MNKFKSGFTCIELMIGIILLSVLVASIAFVVGA